MNANLNHGIPTKLRDHPLAAGRPNPLGATFDGQGVNFAVFSEHATAIDLCLFTEARYTRHPVMADVNSLFQDSPLSLEHYPTGSLMAPPAHLERRR